MNNPQPVRIPAIDGLRGVAVLLVMAYHFDVGLPGGFLGVDVFFAISGFVVARRLLWQFTSPTLGQAGDKPTTRTLLRSFYVGRFWRLFPALAVMVVVVVGVSALMDQVLGRPGRNLANGLAALAGVANWYRLLAPDQAGEIARPLLHTWSLSIEEQFYVCLPLLLAAFRRKVRVAAFVIGSACVLASALPLPSADPSERYFFTLARLAPLGFGVLLAAFLHQGFGSFRSQDFNAFPSPASPSPASPSHASPTRLKRTPTSTDLVCALLGILLLPTLRRSAWNDRSLFPFGLALIGLFSAGIMGLVTVLGLRNPTTPERAGLVPRVLQSKAALYLGSRSYSLYLWHFPIAHLFVSEPRMLRTVAWVALSFAAAELSYRFVESPLRTRTRLPISGGSA
jgi:peptidoglycan/LPS O-acetylase OafA/YrhL